MINYQNYKHYKLPITINPLEYGKLIKKQKQKQEMNLQFKLIELMLL